MPKQTVSQSTPNATQHASITQQEVALHTQNSSVMNTPFKFMLDSHTWSFNRHNTVNTSNAKRQNSRWLVGEVPDFKLLASSSVGGCVNRKREILLVVVVG